MSETPKPYVVRLRAGQKTIEKHVTAYALMEAVMQANILCVAEGEQVDTILEVSPDEKALADRAAFQQELMRADVKQLVRDIIQTAKVPPPPR